jgi:phosphoinositide-3-kinase regulatory subunit 4
VVVAKKSAIHPSNLHDFGPRRVVKVRDLTEARLFRTTWWRGLRQYGEDSQNLVVKAYVKRGVLSSEGCLKIIAELQRAHDLVASLQDPPNIASYSHVGENDQAILLSRQFFFTNLKDRYVTRPYLTPIEKKWIVLQLLNAVAQMHLLGLVHGDIKCENVMVTSWDWVILADMAPFKPAFLSRDSQEGFSFFFDASLSEAEPGCYLAPERFDETRAEELAADAEDSFCFDSQELCAAMDIFSSGCVILELYSEKTAFTRSDMLAFSESTGQERLRALLEFVPDEDGLRAMVGHMVQVDPMKRGTAEQVSLLIINSSPCVQP